MYHLKKYRGLKRYYKNLALDNDFDKFKGLDYFDLNKWHYSRHFHFDWNCFGNYSFKKRKPHLDKLFRHFDILVERSKSLKEDFQLYAILLDYHSGNDSLFFHQPIAGNEQHLFKISDLQLSSTLTNKPLNDYIDQLSGYEKRYGKASEQGGAAFCLI